MSDPALTESEVRKIAHLARLSMDDASVQQYTRELGAILDYAKQLMAIDVEGVEPMAFAVLTENVWRDDEPGEPLPQDAVLANAPDRTDDGFFKMPKVIGEDDSG